MTGYGAAQGPVAGGVFHLEVRSVNHRFFNLAARLPAEFAGYEAELRDQLRQEFERGHLAVSGRWIVPPPSLNGGGLVDPDRARSAAARLRKLQAAAGLAGEITLEMVLRQPEVAAHPESPASPGWDDLLPIVIEASRQCREARLREGVVLVQELRERLAAIGKEADRVRARAPMRVMNERDRLRQAVTLLLEGRPVDEQRLAQEIVFLAERHDVTEELVRLDAHVSACLETLRSEGPIGKRLGFLAQELGREMNTIGSKANDAAIQHAVVAMKGELERFREQLENLE